MNKILSVIIPSYNMECYLTHCLESLLIDEREKLEVFIVNDGSKDSTLDIANKFASLYPETYVVIDKPNGNYGSCINAALPRVTGKYIKVLDADDSFETSNLPNFLSFLEDCNSDLVISDYAVVDEAGATKKEVRFDVKLSKSFQEAMPELKRHDFEMHAVTYKASIFDTLKYRQSEGISYTYQEWMFAPMAQVRDVSYFPRIVYKYLVGREGQTVDPKVSRRTVNHTIKVCEAMVNCYHNIYESISPNHKEYMQSRLMKKVPSVYRIVLLKSSGIEQYPLLMEFDRLLLQYCPEVAEKINRETVKIIPFRFIPYWRKHITVNPHKVPLLINLFQKVISILY